MTERDSFLAAIIEHPSDDAPRLVFADWLDEDGEPERAEFIRAQIELARLGDEDEQGIDLRQRARELLGEHVRTWVKDLPAWTRTASRWLRRGFVSGLASAALPFIKGGKGLAARTPLESLTLRTVAPHLRALADCPALANILELKLTDRDLGNDLPALRALLTSTHLQRLGILEIHDAPLGGRGADVLATASGLTSLTQLHLVGSTIGERGMGRLASAPWSRRCRVLRLVRSFGSAFTPAQARTLGSFSALEELDLSLNFLGSGSASALAKVLTSPLKKLSLRASRPERKGLAALAGSPLLRGVRWLDLDGSDLRDESVVALACPNLGALVGLDLYNNHLTDRSAALLADMPNLASLRALDIGLSEISDDGAAELARSRWLGSLRWLNLNYSRVGEMGRAILRERFGDRLKLEFPKWKSFHTNLPGALGG